MHFLQLCLLLRLLHAIGALGLFGKLGDAHVLFVGPLLRHDGLLLRQLRLQETLPLLFLALALALGLLLERPLCLEGALRGLLLLLHRHGLLAGQQHRLGNTPAGLGNLGAHLHHGARNLGSAGRVTQGSEPGLFGLECSQLLLALGLGFLDFLARQLCCRELVQRFDARGLLRSAPGLFRASLFLRAPARLLLCRRRRRCCCCCRRPSTRLLLCPLLLLLGSQ
jgi:hypothetical protein